MTNKEETKPKKIGGFFRVQQDQLDAVRTGKPSKTSWAIVKAMLEGITKYVKDKET